MTISAKLSAFAALGAAALALSACNAPREYVASRPHVAPAPPVVEVIPVPDAQADLCRAQELQRFVGRRVTELPPVPAGVTRRIAAQNGVMTMDLRMDRQTIIHDSQTTIISIQCV